MVLIQPKCLPFLSLLVLLDRQVLQALPVLQEVTEVMGRQDQQVQPVQLDPPVLTVLTVQMVRPQGLVHQPLQPVLLALQRQDLTHLKFSHLVYLKEQLVLLDLQGLQAQQVLMVLLVRRGLTVLMVLLVLLGLQEAQVQQVLRLVLVHQLQVQAQ